MYLPRSAHDYTNGTTHGNPAFAFRPCHFFRTDPQPRLRSDDCQVTPVIHVLQYPGCVPKPIPSFACIGRCASYIQVSGSKIWQMERSCMCCQESGEREASVSLFCPKAKNGEKKFRKVCAPPSSTMIHFHRCIPRVSLLPVGRWTTMQIFTSPAAFLSPFRLVLVSFM
uniref:Bursicon n=1 Tax=Anopheles atroparvus TaxID=41427 RepID=A0AAG5D071_ANOAO